MVLSTDYHAHLMVLSTDYHAHLMVLSTDYHAHLMVLWRSVISSSEHRHKALYLTQYRTAGTAATHPVRKMSG